MKWLPVGNKGNRTLRSICKTYTDTITLNIQKLTGFSKMFFKELLIRTYSTFD